jgi:hypothetical protein
MAETSTRWWLTQDSTETVIDVNHPGFDGGSTSLRGRWSHANREDPGEAVHAAVHP